MPGFAWFGRGILARGGGYVDMLFSATSGTQLVSYGNHLFTDTTATYLLKDPVVGRPVAFFGTVATGTTYTIVCNTTATLIWSSSGAATGRQFAANGAFGCELVGTSSGAYAVLGTRGNVVFSSST